MTKSQEDASPPDESPLLDALERYADLVDEIRLVVRERRIGAIAWEGLADRIAICSWGRLLRRWRHAIRPDRPPYSLAVRLSKDLPVLLHQVTSSPKRVLRREREREPLHRIREFDSTCMRWVCRQPGVSLAEKAGHQRTLLAVRRFESLNTLENRIVFTLVQRTVRLCRDYLRQHRSVFPSHDRVDRVHKLLRQCRRLLDDPMFADIGLLESIPTPNYVLLHDDRYHAIWGLFVLVMRRQRRRQVLWNHRDSLLLEMLMIATNEFLSRKALRFDRKVGLRYDASLLPSANSGTFVPRDCTPPFWDCRNGNSPCTVHVNLLPGCDDSFVVEYRNSDDGSLSSEHILPVNLMRRLDERLASMLAGVAGQW